MSIGIGILFLIGLGAFECWLPTRSIPFNSSEWKAAKTSEEFEHRFRMIPSVLEMVRVGKLVTIDDFVRELGDPMTRLPSESVKAPAYFTYNLGQEHGSFIRIDNDWLRVSFDEHGKLIECRVAPD